VSYTFNVVTPLLWPIIGSSFPIRVTSAERTEY
jgi:hypothetical protein